MARYWDDKDGNGKTLTDGRLCLVIESDDPNLPDIRTYGRDKEEVLDKVAKTAETAQAEIHRLRNARPAATPSRSAPEVPASGAPSRLTADEQARATVDLSNPAKVGNALKTILRGEGFDIDAQRFRDDTKRMADVAQEWERQHPDRVWKDERNQRMLIDAAVLHFGFRQTMSATAIDSAYEYLAERNMLHEVPEVAPAVPPDGNSDSRTARNATSYRGNSLRGTPPAVVAPKPRYTRAQVDAMNSRVLRDKIENEPGFSEWYNKEFMAATA